MCYILIFNIALERLWYLPTVSSSRSDLDIPDYKAQALGSPPHASLPRLTTCPSWLGTVPALPGHHVPRGFSLWDSVVPLLETVITCALFTLWLLPYPRQNKGPHGHGETQVKHDHVPLVKGIWVVWILMESQVTLNKFKFICLNENTSVKLVTVMIIIIVNTTMGRLNIIF